MPPGRSLRAREFCLAELFIIQQENYYYIIIRINSCHPIERQRQIIKQEEMKMAVPYNHRAIEQKWRKNWEEHPVNVDDGKKPKYYCLDMFPYPSGSGLHVGHWRGYVISDVWSRYKMLQGYYLIHPMGWDAFGLPAENYAIKMGTHPKVTTEENIRNIKRQINEIAAIYDWDMEVNTTDPNFYKWTQWIFVKMFKAGLAYEKEMPINLSLIHISEPTRP